MTGLLNTHTVSSTKFDVKLALPDTANTAGPHFQCIYSAERSNNGVDWALIMTYRSLEHSLQRTNHFHLLQSTLVVFGYADLIRKRRATDSVQILHFKLLSAIFGL